MLPQFTNEPALRLILPALTLLLALTGFLRGLGRLLVLAVSLAGGAAAGMAWFRYGPALCIQWFGSLPVWLVNYGSMIAAVVGAWVVHRLVTGLAGGGGPIDRGARVRGGLIGLIPALVLTWAGAMALRVTGATAGLRELEAAVKGQRAAGVSEPGLLPRVSHSLSTGTVGDLLNRLDPLATGQTVPLASLLVLRHNPVVWDRALRHPQAAVLLQSGAVQRLLRDSDVGNALSFSDYTRLLTLPEMAEALRDPVLRAALLNADMGELLGACITGRSGPAVIPRAIPVPEP
jgi:hypothetical protein